MIPLEQIKVASPCSADWNAMTGTEQVRFCQGCRKLVYNLSEMTADEAQALVTQMEGRLCVRFYTRPDGTMLTQDCPVGLRAVRVKLAKKWSYAVALLLSCGTGLLRWTEATHAATILPGAVPAQTGGKNPVKPPKPSPRLLMGKIANPNFQPTPPVVRPVPNKNPGQTVIGSQPLPRPPKMGEPMMGDIAAPVTMGTPKPPQPK